MKKTLLISFLALLGITQAAAQEYEYIPFVREGVKWVYYIDDYNYHVDFYTNPARGDNKAYRTLELKGDTLINGKIYKAMHLYSGESIDEENDTIPVFLREEDKKVYGIIPNGAKYDHCRIYNFWDERLNGFDHWYNGEEFLLYDFQDPAAQWENLLNSFAMMKTFIPIPVSLQIQSPLEINLQNGTWVRLIRMNTRPSRALV